MNDRPARDRDGDRGFEHLPSKSGEFIEHPSQAQPGIHVYPDKLYVTTVLENPLRWRSRYKNYWLFEAMCNKAGVELYTVEIAFGGRSFEITEAGNSHHLQLRTHDELLHKENALNLLIQRLPPEAQKIATLDADIEFTRADWAQETLHLLDHYKVLQLFSHSMDVGPECEPLHVHESFVMHELALEPHNPTDDPRPTHHAGKHRVEIEPAPPEIPYYAGMEGKQKKYVLWHPGLAWAWRKTALNQLGGLMDWILGGAADHYMALALFNKLTRWKGATLYKFPEGYQKPCFEWQDRAERHIRRNIGYLPGTVLHHWHGAKFNRQYISREMFAASVGFDPGHHLKRDWQGLWQLHDDGSVEYIKIRDGLRHLARLRDEDSMHIECGATRFT
jgi:hypothetical protein